MRRAPAGVRSLAPHKLALAAVVVTATVSATLLAGLVSFAATVTGHAVRATLTSSPATGILVVSPAASPAAAAADAGRVRRALRRALPGGPLAVTGSLSTDYLDIPARLAGPHAQLHVISLAARPGTRCCWPGPGRAGHRPGLRCPWPCRR